MLMLRVVPARYVVIYGDQLLLIFLRLFGHCPFPGTLP